MFDLATLHTLWRYSHMIVGFVGLIVFWIPAVAKKGSPLHIRSGKVFVWCAYYVGITALVSCIWVLAGPRSFFNAVGVAESAARSEFIAQIRMFFAILGFLASSVIVSLALGVAVLRTKKTPQLLATPFLRGMYLAHGGISLALAGFGLWNIPSAGIGSGYLLCVILGLVGVYDAGDARRFMAQPRPTPMAWWYKHMECMVGCGIGFHTAFFVFGFSRLLPDGTLEGPLRLIPWVLPTAVGLPLLAKWIKYYKLKFGELPVHVEQEAKMGT
jgi:hypothetical protein